ncbi:MAG: hypothetical protein V7K31_15640 [Nostoc sp.]
MNKHVIVSFASLLVLAYISSNVAKTAAHTDSTAKSVITGITLLKQKR